MNQAIRLAHLTLELLNIVNIFELIGRFMISTSPYFNYNSNCPEALHFYKNCRGDELIIQPAIDSRMASDMAALRH